MKKLTVRRKFPLLTTISIAFTICSFNSLFAKSNSSDTDSGSKIDILTKRGGTFGKTSFPRQGSIEVSKKHANSFRNKVCTFRMIYGIRASADTKKSFLVKIKIQTKGSSQIHEFMHPRIRRRLVAINQFRIKLKSSFKTDGSVKYRISIDANVKANEVSHVLDRDYSNNKIFFNVKLNGLCEKEKVSETPVVMQDDVPSDQSNQMHTQKYLFEVMAANWAMGFYYKGIYIDKQGRVYSYHYKNRKARFAYEETGCIQNVTNTCLDIKFRQNRKLLTTISKHTLDKYKQLARKINANIKVRTRDICRDAGTVKFYVLSFDKKSGLYKKVKLLEMGDWAGKRYSSEAIEITAWLQKIVGDKYTNCS